MTKNVKYMLLGIFLAVLSVGGFILADEEEFFFIIAIVLPIAAVWAFIKGFMDNSKEHKADEHEDISIELVQPVPVITEQQK